MPTEQPSGRKPKTKDDYRREWEVNKRPPAKSDTAESMKIPELIRSLEYIHQSTGDPIFSDTIAAVSAYGFKGRGLKRGGADARKFSWGDPNEGYLIQIRFNVERYRWSVPVATQAVVARFNVPGQSFDRVVDDLAAKYRTWAAAGHPEPEIVDSGDIGHTWKVFPVKDEPLNLGRQVVPIDGLKVKATAFWRRRFREGVIRVQAAKKLD